MAPKRKTLKEYTCDQCGKKFIFNANDRQYEHHFCNQKCYTLWQTGRKREGYIPAPHTQEFKDDLSKRMQGNQRFKGKKHTQEARDKMSVSVLKNLTENPERYKQMHDVALGSKNSNWRGGTSTLAFEEAHGLTNPEWEIIAKEVRERDGFICQYCGKSRSTIVHHIIPRRISINNDLSNLITLCSPCHFKVEQKTSKLLEQGIDPITIFYEAWSQ